MAKTKADKPAKPKKGEKKSKKSSDASESLLLESREDGAVHGTVDAAAPVETMSPRVLRTIQKSARRVNKAAARLASLAEQLEKALEPSMKRRPADDSSDA